MATYSWRFTGMATNDSTAYLDYSPVSAISATGSTFSFTFPAAKAKGHSTVYGSTTYSRYYYGLNVYLRKGSSSYLSSQTYGNTNSVASDTTWASWSAGSTVSINTSSLFSSSNPTERTVPLTLKTSGYSMYDNSYGQDNSWYSSSEVSIGTVNVTLNVPPTYTLSNLSIDTPYIYTGLTTASVTVSNLSAKYGGNITDITFTIGNTSVSRSNAGTLSILLDTVGTFTPTVVVTDSRGQTTTKTLDPITVNGYVAPAVSFTADRTLSSGVPDDEGGYATVDATFTYTDVVASLVAPSVVLTDENGTQTTPVVTWYTNRAADGTLSGTLSDWSNVARGDTVYGLIPNVNTQYSYQISIRPRDTEGTGTAISQTLSSAFYTVDFLAGGHGIAFGKPASNTGFECAMDATFEETLTAQDMTQQEVDDFVDNLDIGAREPLIRIASLAFNGFDGSAAYTIPCTSINGYTCVGVVGFRAGGSAQVTTDACDMYVNVANQQITFTNYNRFNGSQYYATFWLLYVKNDFIG